MTDNLTSWLQKPSCYDTLLCCADFIIRKSRRSGISLPLLFQEEITEEAGTLEKVVADQLWLFLREKPSLYANISVSSGRTDLRAFMTIVADAFLANCLDQRRTFSINPSYAYYRHLRQVLSCAEEVRFEPTNRGSFFAYSDFTVSHLPHHRWNQSYADWPHPAVPTMHINQREGMLKVSRFYWDESLIHFLDEYLLPVKELARFVDFKYILAASIESEAVLSAQDGAEEETARSIDEMLVQSGPDDVLGTRRRQNHRIDYDVIETELADLARDCVLEMTERQRTILVRVDAGATLQEVAGEQESASNVHYHLKKAYQTMKRKWSAWGPPSLTTFTEVEEEEFFIFYDKVVEICKSGVACRR